MIRWYVACFDYARGVCTRVSVAVKPGNALPGRPKEIDMAENGTLHDAFVEELPDTYDADKQLTKALPKLAEAASSPGLRAAFESHLEETRGHVERLEQVFETIDEKVKGKHCEGIAGIIEEGKTIMEENFDGSTMDAALIAA